MKNLFRILVFALVFAACGDGRLSPQGGTIVGVNAGTGLTGGGVTGSVTLNVACGYGLTCLVDSIAVDATVMVDGSGTLNYIPLWTPDGNTLGNSIVSQISTTGVRVHTGDIGVNPYPSTGSWVTAPGWTVFGPNASVATAGNIGIGWSTTFDGAAISAIAPGVGWKSIYLTGSGIIMRPEGNTNYDATFGPTGLTLAKALVVGETAQVLGSLTSGDASGDIFDHNGDLAKFGSTDGVVFIENGSGISFSYSTNGESTGAMLYTGYQNGFSHFRNLQIYDGKGAATCLFTGSTKSLNCVGGMQENGTAVLSGTISDNYVPIGTAGGNLENSSISDGGTGIVGIQPVADDVYLVLGVNGTGATDAAIVLNANPDDNAFIDAKVGNNDSLFFRIGHNTENRAARTWLTVTGSNGNAAFGAAITEAGAAVLSGAITDGVYPIGSSGNLANSPLSYNGIDTITSTARSFTISSSAGAATGIVWGQSGQTIWQFYQPASANTFHLWNSVNGDVMSWATNDVTFADAVTVNGPATLGDAVTDQHRLNGALGINNAGSINYEIYATPSNSSPNTDLRFESSDAKALEINVLSGSSAVTMTATNGYSITGAANFVNNLSTDANFTAGNLASADLATITGGLRHVSVTQPALGTLATWDNTAAVFGPNAASNTGAAVGVGYNTGADAGVILAAAPGVSWKPLVLASSSTQFYNGSATVMTVASTVSTTVDTTLGDTAASDILTFNGAARFNYQMFAGDTGSTSIADNLDVLTIGNTGTGQTTTAKALLNLDNTGTYNATAGDVAAHGIDITMTATRSAGANNFFNIAARLDANGGQVNYALYTLRGDNQFNVTSGNSTFQNGVNIGSDSGDAHSLTGTLSVNGGGTGNNGEVLSIVGGAPYWTQANDHTRGVEVFDEFLNTPTATFANSWKTDDGLYQWMGGFFAIDDAVSNRPGILGLRGYDNVTTIGGNAAPRYARVIKGDTSAGVGYGWFAGGGTTKVAGAFKIGSLLSPPVDDSDSYTFHIGLFDTITTTGATADYPPNGIFCRIGSASTNIQVCTAEADTQSCTDTSPALAITEDKWYRCEFTVNAAGTQVDFTVTNVTDATSGTASRTTNIPNDSTHSVGLGASVDTIDNAGHGYVYLDYLWFDQVFTTAR